MKEFKTLNEQSVNTILKTKKRMSHLRYPLFKVSDYGVVVLVPGTTG